MGAELKHNSETDSFWEENFKRSIRAHERKSNMED